MYVKDILKDMNEMCLKLSECGSNISKSSIFSNMRDLHTRISNHISV